MHICSLPLKIETPGCFQIMILRYTFSLNKETKCHVYLFFGVEKVKGKNSPQKSAISTLQFDDRLMDRNNSL